MFRDTDPHRIGRGVLVVLAAVVLLLASGHAPAASVFDVDRWMREIDHRSVDVQKHLAARDAAAAGADAAALAKAYADLAAFFEQEAAASGADLHDAVAISRDGRARADAIGPLLAGGDWDAAARHAREISHACNDCHDRWKPYR